MKPWVDKVKALPPIVAILGVTRLKAGGGWF